ncbi:ATP-binding protein [Paraburkholderia youngii]|uniref:ATP-binding protein n=1 Tax=Paraburkholderia youngii TaxID=2782701 RepID=UPI003D1FB865
MSANPPIRPKDRDRLMQALSAGVVPSIGQHHIAVGRNKELDALLRNIMRVADGGSSFTLVTGEYGSGKTFFVELVNAIALEKKLVATRADLDPQRRLHATQGQARSLYRELMRNISTRAKPEGEALASIVEKFVGSARSEAREANETVESVIHRKLDELKQLTNGYDFADVIAAYCRGHNEGSEQLKSDALRWLRGEFNTKSDARRALGVGSIVDDDNVYDQLKLMARFVRLAGYAGLWCGFDECVILYKMKSPQARDMNYEQILRMLNDSLQGNTVGLGLVLSGTPEFLMDPRRGLYSYGALQLRLTQNKFATGALVDYSGPVLRLSALTPEDFFVLLQKIRHVHASGVSESYLLPDDGIVAFMEHASKRVGDSYFRTPRTTITSFIQLLAVLEQNRDAKWQDLLGAVEVARDTGGEDERRQEEDANGDGPAPSTTVAGAAVQTTTAPSTPNLFPTAEAEDDAFASFKL